MNGLTFNIDDDTVPIEKYRFASMSQMKKARDINAVRIFKTAYMQNLPIYIRKTIRDSGYYAVRIGTSSYTSAAWALTREMP